MPDGYRPKLVELQCELVAFLAGGTSVADRFVADQPPLSPAERLSIYGTAYVIRLREALENDHEMLGYYLGDEHFARMADAFIAAHPSRVTSLRYFGDALPDFLAGTPPFSELPVIAELARFERLLLDVFDSADAPRASREALAGVPAAHWPTLQLRFHPSVRLVRLQTNAVPIWHALKRRTTPPVAAVDSATDWLLWRDTDRLSVFRPVEKRELRLLNMAMGGEFFSHWCECLLDELPSSEISSVVLAALLEWLDRGLVQQVSPDV